MSVLYAIALVFLLGIGAQWIAWRFRLPSILILLIFGLLVGPISGAIPSASLQGDWLFAFVSLSVGIILFEGGLSLGVAELREIGRPVRNLITIGVLVTGVLGALAAHTLLGFSPGLSLILGAILTVTGPTVIIPLLRHIRPVGRVGAVAKWEGITIDPAGAILSLLVLEAVLLVGESGAHGADLQTALGDTIRALLMEGFIGLAVGVTGAGVLVVVLRQRMVPDFLQNSVALIVVIAVFALSDYLQEESGLLATTLMGIIMANQKWAIVQRIVTFKEDLRVVLISVLFIVLTARLDMTSVQYIGWHTAAFLGVLILLIRPAAVFLSTLRTDLNLKEKVFLSWLAPRGIVAAAVGSLFGIRLEAAYPEQAAMLAPVVFFVIIGTVAVYGLTISPIARWLGLARPDPQGVLFVGAHGWARKLAQALMDRDIDVVMVDTNQNNVDAAQEAGINAYRADILSETTVDEIPLSGLGRLVAVTPNDQVNTLAALHFVEIFESSHVYQLSDQAADRFGHESDMPHYLRGRPLFGPGMSYLALTDLFRRGATIEEQILDEKTTFRSFRARSAFTPLFLIHKNGELEIFAEADTLTPQSGDTLIYLRHPDKNGSESKQSEG